MSLPVFYVKRDANDYEAYHVRCLRDGGADDYVCTINEFHLGWFLSEFDMEFLRNAEDCGVPVALSVDAAFAGMQKQWRRKAK
jgi:sugar/nucleoside kinase (ribokinase family)